MIRFHELVFGYENVARLQMEKGNYVNAKEQLRKALRTIKKEKFTENEKREVLVTLDKIFEDYIKMEEPSSCLDTIEAIKFITNGNADVRKYGEIFLNKFSKAADFYQYESRLKELVPSIQEGTKNYTESTIAQEINGGGGNSSFTSDIISQNEGKKEDNLPKSSSDGGDIFAIKMALAKAEYNRNNREMAIKILNEILSERPDYKDARAMLESIMMAEEKEKILKELNDRMNRLGIQDQEIREILTYAFQNNLEKANEMVTKGIAIKRENADLWLLKAYIVKKMGNNKLSENFESFARKLNPNIVKGNLYRELFEKS